MGNHERQPATIAQGEVEILNPHHFYAAYIFDQASERESDIRSLIDEAKGLGYPVRHWWLSDAMDLQGCPDRLIVCIHHPSGLENAGMDLYDALRENDVKWDDLEAAVVEEYSSLGKQVESLIDLRAADGNRLFPISTQETEDVSQPEDTIFTITEEDVREEAESCLSRELTDEEIPAVLERFKKNLEYLDWRSYLDEAIQQCLSEGKIGPIDDPSPSLS
jgi:hypothetical protein